MPRNKKEKSFYPPILTRYAMQDRKAWPHLRILVVLADNYVYFKENRVYKKFEIQELADLCRVQRNQVNKSLKYLRENHYLVTIAGDEYVNPIYCCQCKEKDHKALIDFIVNEHPMYVNNVLITKPSYWPRYDFSLIKPAQSNTDHQPLPRIGPAERGYKDKTSGR
jgi:hypothetical protein